MMSWYYADSGQQKGPITDEELQALVRSGKITDQTLVWQEGMANWQPYGTVKPAAAAPSGLPPLTGGVVCRECGKSFPPGEVIRYGDVFVCAACKPVFIQRLREGAGPGGTGAGVATEEEVAAREYEVDIGSCFSQGWDSFKANAGIMIGATVLVYLVVLVVNVIPYVSYILALVFNGPLLGGLWYFYIRKTRGEEATVGDAFSGFGPRFLPLMLTNIVSGLLAGLCVVPGVLVLVLSFFAGGGFRGGPPHLAVPVVVGGVLLLLLGIVGAVYLSTIWFYALALVADKGLNFWAAMQLSRRVVIKHWWMNFLLIFVAGIIAGAGVLACLVGLLVTGPLYFAILTQHYQKVFGDLAPSGS
jgi:hypothetical protein